MKHLLSFALFFALTTSTFAQHPDDYRWDDRFGAPGININNTGTKTFTINAITIDGNDIYVGGVFTSAGNNIAVWQQNTSRWLQLGEGINGKVNVIKVVGDNAYVGGAFTEAGGVAVSNIAVWNKISQKWSALGNGINGEVISMEFYKNELHIGGNFSASGDSAMNCISRWDGTSWKSLGSGVNNGVFFGQVNCLASFNNELWVGGSFEAAGGNDKARNLAVWNGNSWNPVQNITYNMRNGYVQDMKTVGNLLFISAIMDSLRFNNSPTNINPTGLITYNGTTWNSPITTFGKYNGARAPYMATSGQDLYVLSNQIEEVNGILAKGIARWNSITDTWSALGSGISSSTTTFLTSAIAASSTVVVAAGDFAEAGGQFVNNIALFNIPNNSWQSLAGKATLGLIPNRNSQFTSPLITNINGLVAVGGFDYAGNNRVNGITRWSGDTWEPIGSGLIGGLQNRGVKTNGIIVYVAGSFNTAVQKNGSIIIGGDFDGIGGTNASCLAEYKDGAITPIGGGVNGAFSSGSSNPGYLSVNALLVDNNDLYVGGVFQYAGNVPANSIAKWDGKKWDDMGGGVTLQNGNYASYPSVTSIAKAPNGDIYVGGAFDNAGGVKVDGIARWDGKKWYNVGQNQYDNFLVNIRSMVFIGNDLYVTGIFKRINGVIASNVARWDGQTWSSVSSGIRGKNGFAYGYTLAAKGDELYVGGIFDVVGDTKAKNIAVWNTRTQTWSALGSGIKNSADGGAVYTIVIQNDTVFCAGLFEIAGSKPSFNIAAWLPTKSNSVEYIGNTLSTVPSVTCFPNPSSSVTTFNVSQTQASELRLTISDALGRIVLHVANEYLVAGQYTITADVSALSTGMYYARMESGGTIATTIVSIIH